MATATKAMMLDETGKQIVDELKKIADIKGSAIGTTFDDSAAHLGTTNAQGAIDKLKSNADTLAGNVTEAEQNISTNTQNIAANAAAISQQSSQIADISSEIKVEKSVVVDDNAIVDSGSGVLNDLVLYGRSHQDGTPTPENPSAIRALSGIKTENEDKSESTESALPTLYGKEVASGGNYTDIEGKKWLSDVLRIEHGDIERYLGVRKPPYTESDIVALNDTYGRGQIQLATTSKHGTWAIMSNCFSADITDGDSAGYLFASSMNWGDSYRVIFTLGSAFNTKAKIADELNRIGAEFVYELPSPVTEPIPQSVLNTLRSLRSFSDKTHIYCDNGSLEAVIAENTEVGNAIGRNAIKLNEILNHLNPITASVEE